VPEPLKLSDAGVVVTGAASGIGLGLATRFVAEGARVVLCDRDADGLAAATSGIEAGQLHTVVADLSTAGGTERLVAEALGHLGEIDLFCANAGIAPRGGIEGRHVATPEAWQASWDVNVMSHVHAAQALLPAWLERGRGHFLATASAAGLLTMLGSAPYAVSKHAVLAFAEWLRASYDHRGITVQALCPQGVRTPMLDATGADGRLLLEPRSVSVEEVAQTVVDALADGRFLVLPHPEVAGFVRDKAADHDAWLGAMNHLQQKLEDG
jgi:NAD(P)-dependent dehydrogenase (short-subunit alcohol dehydrogenase family)